MWLDKAGAGQYHKRFEARGRLPLPPSLSLSLCLVVRERYQRARGGGGALIFLLTCELCLFPSGKRLHGNHTSVLSRIRTQADYAPPLPPPELLIRKRGMERGDV